MTLLDFFRFSFCKSATDSEITGNRKESHFFLFQDHLQLFKTPPTHMLFNLVPVLWRHRLVNQSCLLDINSRDGGAVLI